ncbi:MAG: hypothetical protein ACRC38_11435 [Plesiomonas sp.]
MFIKEVKRRVMLEIIVLPLLTMATCKETRAAIIVLHKNGFTGKDIVATKIAPKSTIYRIISNLKERGSILAKKASGRPLKVQQLPGSSPKEDSAAGSECHQCRAWTNKNPLILTNVEFTQTVSVKSCLGKSTPVCSVRFL